MQLRHSFCALAVVACVLFTGCDSFTGSHEGALPDQSAVSTSENAADSTLSFRQWPEGIPLPSVAEWNESRGRLEKSGPTFPEGASPYGCLISTLDPNAAPHPYRYDDVYVHYPDSLITIAGDSTETLTITYGSNSLFADSLRQEDIVVRVARCRIPDVEGARTPLVDRLHRFNERNTPAKPEAEEATVPVSEFLSDIHGKQTSSPKYLEEDGCTEAIICMGSSCWVDSEECPDGGNPPPSGGGEGGDGGEGGGSGALPGTGDGGNELDPCDGTRTSFCDDRPPTEPESIIPPPAGNDYVVLTDSFDIQEDAPNCSVSHSKEWKEMFCLSSRPQGSRRNKTEDALTRIEARGDVCRKIASYGREMLNAGTLRFFPDAPGRTGGIGATGLILLNEFWVTETPTTPIEETLPDGSTIERNLEFMLVHEIDHARIGGNIHSNYGYSTPNTKNAQG